ncbi:MAG TPA: LacI family DNA-binding transcriptional regulator [Chthonomonadaceae bacterium]|nr:LacI family DNA-binding transcriptional regulator [Chthonomonadaceae bacterium]
MTNPSKPRISSHDVARKAGVSQSTVSLVLNGRSDVRIPESTRQRVLEAARELNYARNAAARALVTGKTHRIGVLPIHPRCFLDHGSYYGNLITGIIAGALRFNYNLLLHSAFHPNWRDTYEDILSGSADGVLLIGRPPRDELTLALLEARYPTVCISYHPDASEYHSVDCDNITGGYLAAQHLLELGHRHLLYDDSDDPDYSWIQERRQGILRALEDAGLDASHLLSFGGPVARTGQLLKVLRADKNAPTALLFNDEVGAKGVAEALPNYGFRVPEDVSILNFNSTAISAHARPPLTSIGQPLGDIGEGAVEMLIGIVEGHDVPYGTRRFPMHLDIRASTAPAPTPDPSPINGRGEIRG